MFMPYKGPDLSYAQGAWRPQGWEHFGIVNASRANVGWAVGSYYHWQVDRLRQALLEVGHYFFIGNVDAIAAADFFVDNLYDFRKGDSLWLDMEPEPGTGTVVWSPAKCLAFCLRVFQRTGVMPGIYLNKSLENAYDWSSLVAAGVRLWSAYYQGGALPYVRNWPEVSMLQYTSTPIDTNAAAYTQAQMAGTAQEDEMSQADVDAINAHTTSETNRLAGYVRRETRARLYQNTATMLYMVAKIDTGYCRVLAGATQADQESEIASLKANGYLEIATEETAQPVNQDQWNNIIAKCAAARQAVAAAVIAALPTGQGAPTAEQITAAVQAGLTGIKIQVDANALTSTILDAASARLSA